MEVFCLHIEYAGQRIIDSYSTHTLWSNLESAKKALKEERDTILNNKSWLNIEDCIERDEEEYFSVCDGQEFYSVFIFKEKVHE